MICPICFWEDEGEDVDDLDQESSPNHGITLREARLNFKEFGAGELKMKKHVFPESKRKQFDYNPRSL
ncbi:MAG TPA: CPCC family cysteine-rich protein [Gammaproteobacteria bacterium]|nr:hypothetical protein [Xanthomonadales bacterium]MCB1594059.1 hypothetical protein [Xanthomonadales bacterium]HOP22749.1 CPCC family cysteine-rich protein [Gammaproteobacteria bacterium]HPI96384.1 CPCC family cysteine-rich protein [Gammaproteobacteria bacterium]HPQ86534.1 CPCC family cysteine-rich protein [Gammaproteobacteria bacterium]